MIIKRAFNGFLRQLPEFILVLYVVAVTAGAFNGGMWASIGIGGAIIFFLSVWVIDRKMPRPDKNFIIMGSALLFVAALLNFHSSQPGLSWQEWIKLLTIFLPLSFFFAPPLLPHAAQSKFFNALPVAILIGGLALSVELYLGGPMLHHFRGPNALIEGYNRGASYIALMAFPVMASLWLSGKRWLIVPFFLLLLVPASLTDSRTTKLALMAAIPVIAIAHLWPVLVTRLLAVTPFLTLGWPFAAQWFFATHYDILSRVPNSWRARIEIWDYMSYRIAERPLLGWGLGTSHTLPFMEPHGASYVFTVRPAAHPHNVTTQLWVELGLPGLVLGIAFALLTLRKASRLDPRIAPFAIGAWISAFCLSSLAYGFWTDSLFAAFAMTGFAFLLLQQKLKTSPSSMASTEAR